MPHRPVADRRLWLAFLFLAGMIGQLVIVFLFDFRHSSLGWKEALDLTDHLLDQYLGPIAVILTGVVTTKAEPDTGKSFVAFSFAVVFIIIWDVILTAPLLMFSFAAGGMMKPSDILASIDSEGKHMTSALDLVLALFFAKVATSAIGSESSTT